jgi:hypothetical protein
MRRAKRLCGVIGVLFSSLAFIYAEASNAEEWGFLDMKSGASALLSTSPPHLVIAEGAIGVRFCDASSDLVCFDSEIFSFAVPRDPEEFGKSWRSGGRVYCLVRRFNDTFGNGGRRGAWLIFSRRGDACETGDAFDQSAIYSTTAGLRMLFRTTGSGGYNQLLAVDRVGFGAPAR